ncbi:MAG: hypothetical protein QGG42_10385 [Phycisphaerae bacterium]|nr:hypothetical protein [Phycisphaerae bacterium]
MRLDGQTNWGFEFAEIHRAGDNGSGVDRAMDRISSFLRLTGVWGYPGMFAKFTVVAVLAIVSVQCALAADKSGRPGAGGSTRRAIT